MCVTAAGLEVTRLTLVNERGHIILDEHIKPLLPILDYRTAYSGITPTILSSVTTTLPSLHPRLLSLLHEKPTYLVGHALDGDLRALKLFHPFLLDTASLYPHPKGSPYKKSLKDLARIHLEGREIQQGHGSSGHE